MLQWLLVVCAHVLCGFREVVRSLPCSSTGAALHSYPLRSDRLHEMDALVLDSWKSHRARLEACARTQHTHQMSQV